MPTEGGVSLYTRENDNLYVVLPLCGLEALWGATPAKQAPRRVLRSPEERQEGDNA
jgi:hypothetical protein